MVIADLEEAKARREENYIEEVYRLGVTLAGMDFRDLDGDKIPDVCSSRVAMERLCQLVTEPTDFIVVDP